MRLKVFNKLGTGHFFIEVKSTRDIEVVAERASSSSTFTNKG